MVKKRGRRAGEHIGEQRATMNFKPASSRVELIDELFEEATAQNLTNVRIAAALNVTSVSVSRWKHGASNPDFYNVDRMAQLLGYKLVKEKV